MVTVGFGELGCVHPGTQCDCCLRRQDKIILHAITCLLVARRAVASRPGVPPEARSTATVTSAISMDSLNLLMLGRAHIYTAIHTSPDLALAAPNI